MPPILVTILPLICPRAHYNSSINNNRFSDSNVMTSFRQNWILQVWGKQKKTKIKAKKEYLANAVSRHAMAWWTFTMFALQQSNLCFVTRGLTQPILKLPVTFKAHTFLQSVELLLWFNISFSHFSAYSLLEYRGINLLRWPTTVRLQYSHVAYFVSSLTAKPLLLVITVQLQAWHIAYVMLGSFA